LAELLKVNFFSFEDSTQDIQNPHNKQKKHLHHDHTQEKNNVIAYAYSRCNMQMTEKRRARVPVVFHNGSGYDWKFLMRVREGSK